MNFTIIDISTTETLNDILEMLKLKFSNLKISTIGKEPPYTVKVEDVATQNIPNPPIEEITTTYTPQNTLINKITIRSIEELLSHESIVREAYKDSQNIWTWSVGITNSSGHKVYPRYKDNPQSLKYCLEVFEWLIRVEYLPTVQEVFKGFDLTEAQIAAALSFHYNTGGLRKASWVKQWKNGDIDKAYNSFMSWRKPASIIPRREKERDLFFKGKWSSNGKIIEYPVKKPSYKPNLRRGKSVNIKSILKELFE